MKRKTLTALLISYGIIGLFFSPAFSVDAPQSKEAKQIVALVDKAAALTESKGKIRLPGIQEERKRMAYSGNLHLYY